MNKLWWLESEALLKDLNQNEIAYLFKLAELTKFDADQVVFSSDLPGDTLYFMQKGQAHVFHKTSIGTTRKLTTLTKGSAFGKLGLIELGQKSAHIKTQVPSQMLVLRKAAFEKLIKCSPKISSQLVSTLKEYIEAAEHSNLLKEYQIGQYRFRRLIERYVDNQDFKVNDKQIEFLYNTQELVHLTQLSESTVKYCLEKLIQDKVVTLNHKFIKIV